MDLQRSESIENNNSPDRKINGARSTTVNLVLLVPLFFAAGVALGKLDWQSVSRSFSEAYMNHYLTRSGANVERYIYYVQTDNESALRELGLQHTGILEVESTRYSRLFNVHLTDAARRSSITRLRALDGVSAVFTIPFMCH